MRARKLIKPETPEWARMWYMLAVKHGSVAGWDYIGTEQADNGLWFHLLRNPNYRGRTTVVKILAGE